MKRRSFDETESGRVVNRPASVSELPLFGGAPASAQPAIKVAVASYFRTVDSSKPATDEERKLDERFAVWVVEREDLLELIAKQAMDMLAAGESRISVKFLVECVRRQTKQAINNSFTSRIGRLLIELHPSLREAIELRPLTSKHEAAA